jgi:hypothetical protein
MAIDSSAEKLASEGLINEQFSSTTSSIEGSQPRKVSPEKTVTDWDGPNDVGNPRNWSLGARIYGVAIPAWYAFVV